MIKFNDKINRELKTLASISKDGVEIFLTESDIFDLMEEILNNRPEFYEEFGLVDYRDMGCECYIDDACECGCHY